MNDQIRRLKNDEPSPSGEPRRYRASTGYIVLRWKVGVRSYVERLEHRHIAGCHKPEVHHRNRIRDDNAPENLQPVTTSEHGREHCTFDVETAARLYREGQPITEIARVLGVDNSAICRVLHSLGVATRTPRESRLLSRPVDETRLRALHAKGLGVRSIAGVMGETRIVIRQRMKMLGLKPRRPGNYTRDERMGLA